MIDNCKYKIGQHVFEGRDELSSFMANIVDNAGSLDVLELIGVSSSLSDLELSQGNQKIASVAGILESVGIKFKIATSLLPIADTDSMVAYTMSGAKETNILATLFMSVADSGSVDIILEAVLGAFVTAEPAPLTANRLKLLDHLLGNTALGDQEHYSKKEVAVDILTRSLDLLSNGDNRNLTDVLNIAKFGKGTNTVTAKDLGINTKETTMTTGELVTNTLKSYFRSTKDRPGVKYDRKTKSRKGKGQKKYVRYYNTRSFKGKSDKTITKKTTKKTYKKKSTVDAAREVNEAVGKLQVLEAARRLQKLNPDLNISFFTSAEAEAHGVSGKVAGFWENGAWINLDIASTTTPLHELLHPFMDTFAIENPEAFDNLKQQVMVTDVHDRVVNDPEYAGLDEDQLAMEAIIRHIELRANGQKPTIWSRIKSGVNSLFRWIKNLFNSEPSVIDLLEPWQWAKLSLGEFSTLIAEQSMIRPLLKSYQFNMEPVRQYSTIDATGLINNMKSRIKLDKNTHKYTFDGEPAIGVSESINLLLADRHEAFSAEQYMQAMTKNINNDPGLTDDQKAMELVKLANEVGKWPKIAKLGTDVHELNQLVFEQLSETSSFYDLDPKKYGFANDQALKVYLDNLLKLRQSILARHMVGGRKPQIFAEVTIGYKTTKAYAGTVDLLIVDGNGEVHIYDWKTSMKGEQQWSTYKNHAIIYQQTMYRNLLSQYGFKIASQNVVPIELGATEQNGRLLATTSGYIGSVALSALETGKSFHNLTSIEADVDSNLVPFKDNGKLKGPTNGTGAKVKEDMFVMFGDTDSMNQMDYDKFMKSRLKVDDQGREYVINRIPGSKELGTRKYLATEADKRAYFETYQLGRANVHKQFSTFVREMLTEIARNPKTKKRFTWAIRDQETSANVDKFLTKYRIEKGWEFVESADAAELGLVVLRHADTNRVDILSMVSGRLADTIELPLGKKLGGMLFKDYENTLPEATRESIEMSKIGLFIARNQTLMAGNTISSIRVINESSRIADMATGNLRQIFERLSTLNSRAKRDVEFEYSQFNEDYLDSLRSFLSQLADPHQKDLDLLTTIKKEDTSLIKAGLKKRLQDLSYLINKSDTSDLSRDTAYSVYITAQAILQLEGRDPIIFEDMKSVGFLFNENRLLSNPNEISNEAYRVMQDYIRQGTSNFLESYRKYKSEVQGTVAKLYGMSSKAKRALIGGRSAFDRLIVPGTMRLKNVNDPSLTKEESDFIRMFATKVGSIRNARNRDKVENPIELGYDIPLIRADTTELFGKKGLSGVDESIKTAWTNFKENTFSSVDRGFSRYEWERENSNQLVYSKLNDAMAYTEANRDKILEENPNAYSTHLEDVLDLFMQNEIRMQEFSKVLPYINAAETLVAYNDLINFKALPVTQDAMRKQVDLVLFGIKNLPKESKDVAVLVNLARNFTSTMALAANPFSGATNFFQGLWASIGMVSRSFARPGLFGYKELAQAWGVVTTNSLVNFTLLEELNRHYALNSIDMQNVVRRYSEDQGFLSRFRSRWMYWFNSAPDFYHRSSFFTAQLIKDGVIDFTAAGTISDKSAVTIVNGKLVYDEAKDRRFSKMHDNSPEGKRQKALYQSVKQQMLAEGLIKSESDRLPIPYTMQEKDSLRHFADSAFGSYTHENRARMENDVWGSLFMQFQTWVLAKKNNWYKQTSKSTVEGYWKEQFDGQDNPLPPIWEGRMTEGIVQSLAYTFKEILNNGRDFKLESYRKENLYHAGTDLALWASLAIFAKMLDLDELKKDKNGMNAAMARVFMNSYKDLFVVNLIGMYFTTRMPITPIAYPVDVATKFMQVLTGQKEPTYMMTTLGTIRPYYWMME